MCILNAEPARVNSGSRQLFDVVGFNALGEACLAIGEQLPLQAAISRSLGFNARPGQIIAAVVPSGCTPSEKLGNLQSETASEPVDASSAEDDSDATEATEDATESNVAGRSEITVRTIRWKCPDSGRWLFWPESVDEEKAGELLDGFKRREFTAELVTFQMGDYEILQQKVYNALLPGSATADDDDDGDDDNLYRILCLPYCGGAPFLAQGQYDREQAEEWIDTWQGNATAWMVKDCQPDTAADAVAAAIQKACQEGDYTRLPGLGLGLGLIRHLRQVTSAIVAGKVTSVAHIGMVARSLERFAAQCCDGREPDAHGTYDCDEFTRGMTGDIRDDELEPILNHWLDVGLERDFPQLLEEEAEQPEREAAGV